jgi:uncharacterized protein
MRIGIFADAHDHVDNVRRAVHAFESRGCGLVVFAGDFVSPIVVPALRKLSCPVLACFGDNEGNRTGIAGGMRIVGPVAEPPFGFETPDGIRIVVAHVPGPLQHEVDGRPLCDGADVVVTAHTHKPRIARDDAGRLWINPGETSGWTYREPTVVILDTAPLAAEVVPLGPMPAPWEPPG